MIQEDCKEGLNVEMRDKNQSQSKSKTLYNLFRIQVDGCRRKGKRKISNSFKE